jgi:small subunit ribosomal protein S4
VPGEEEAPCLTTRRSNGFRSSQLARYTGPKCKLCRREGVKLFLKGERCDTARCALERREFPPGMHTWGRRKITPYGLQLREKQKVKRYYGLLERQFRLCFRRAERARGNTGENLLLALERRVDNVVASAGFATSRSQARQMVTHGHFLVNGHRVTIPSQELKPGDEVTVANRDKARALVQANMEKTQNRPVPTWLDVATEPPSARVARPVTREDVTLPVQEQLVVELLSK